MTESLEQEVKRLLTQKGVAFQDRSASFKEPDFTILVNKLPYFHLEVKEKRQHYNLKHWDSSIEERHLFILDDLTVRKCLAYSPKSGILIRDNLRKMYFFFSIVDLALMPKRRVNRPIQRNLAALKGKWLIDLNHGAKSTSLETILASLRQYVETSDEILFENIECHGHYQGEEIALGGIPRKPKHWQTDVEATR